MGLFDQLASIAGEALSAAAQQAGPLLANALNTAETGGLAGITDKLKEAGLGDQVASWLGNGQNLPISADQIRAALGDEHLKQLAASVGLPLDQVTGALANFLPGLVDQASPNGEIQPPSA